MVVVPHHVTVGGATVISTISRSDLKGGSGGGGGHSTFGRRKKRRKKEIQLCRQWRTQPTLPNPSFRSRDKTNPTKGGWLFLFIRPPHLFHLICLLSLPPISFLPTLFWSHLAWRGVRELGTAEAICFPDNQGVAVVVQLQTVRCVGKTITMISYVLLVG